MYPVHAAWQVVRHTSLQADLIFHIHFPILFPARSPEASLAIFVFLNSFSSVFFHRGKLAARMRFCSCENAEQQCFSPDDRLPPLRFRRLGRVDLLVLLF